MGSSLKYRAGLCLIVAVVLIWVISAEVTQVWIFLVLYLFHSKRALLFVFLFIYLEVLRSCLGMHACLSDWFGSFGGRNCSLLIRLILLDRVGVCCPASQFLNVTHRYSCTCNRKLLREMLTRRRFSSNGKEKSVILLSINPEAVLKNLHTCSLKVATNAFVDV